MRQEKMNERTILDQYDGEIVSEDDYSTMEIDQSVIYGGTPPEIAVFLNRYPRQVTFRIDGGLSGLTLELSDANEHIGTFGLTELSFRQAIQWLVDGEDGGR